MKRKILTTQKFMNKISSFYDEVCFPCSCQRIEFLSNIINKHKINTFIDASCSTGETLKNLSNIKCEFIGIDFSKGMIKIAKRKNKKDNIKFEIASMVDYFDDNIKYSCIYSNSMNWLPSYNIFEKTLIKMYQSLSNDGLLIIDLPTNGNILYNQNMQRTVSYNNHVCTKDTIIFKNNLDYENNSDICYQTYSILDINTKKIKSYKGKFSLLPISEELLLNMLKRNNLDLYQKFIGYGTEKGNYNQYIIYKNKPV